MKALALRAEDVCGLTDVRSSCFPVLLHELALSIGRLEILVSSVRPVSVADAQLCLVVTSTISTLKGTNGHSRVLLEETH